MGRGGRLPPCRRRAIDGGKTPPRRTPLATTRAPRGGGSSLAIAILEGFNGSATGFALEAVKVIIVNR
jgi:hypothetical protein